MVSWWFTFITGGMMELKEVKQEELYEQFQEWLNQCPIKITDYTDNVTDFAVDFSIEVD